MDKKTRRSKRNFLLIASVILLSVMPLLMIKDAAFSGADGEAEGAIMEIATAYKPWFEPIIEPASGEIESLLFALQAAIGAGVLAYGFGYLKGVSKKQQKEINDGNY